STAGCPPASRKRSSSRRRSKPWSARSNRFRPDLGLQSTVRSPSRERTVFLCARHNRRSFRPMIRLQEILVPVDFSTASDSALTYAQALAETFHARLHVLHVLEDWVLYGGLDPAPPEVRTELERSARENLGKMLSDEVVRALRVEKVLKVGSPFVEIVRYAK